MPNAKESFHKIIEQKKTGLQPLAIFDLDSTLFEISRRSQKILEDVSALSEMRDRWPVECGVLSDIEMIPTDWGIRTALIRSKMKAPLDFFEAVRNHWRERFFSSDYLSEDQVYEGAVEYVNGLAEAGVDIIYLTGRNQEKMALGTMESLKQWGFPFSNETTIVGGQKPGRAFLKPSQDLKDSEFKNQFLKNLQHPHRQCWFFDNEASIIEIVEQSCPNMNIIFLDTIHSGKSNSPTHLPTIRGQFSK